MNRRQKKKFEKKLHHKKYGIVLFTSLIKKDDDGIGILVTSVHNGTRKIYQMCMFEKLGSYQSINSTIDTSTKYRVSEYVGLKGQKYFNYERDNMITSIEMIPKELDEDAKYDECGKTTVAVLRINNIIRIPLCEDCVKTLTNDLNKFNNTVFCHKCKHSQMNEYGWSYGGRCVLHNKGIDYMDTCDDADGQEFNRQNLTALDFRNDLVRRLNVNANRYTGGTCNGTEYPEAQTFEVDEVYEIIDRVLHGIPEDDGSV